MYNINRTYVFKNLYSNLYIAEKLPIEEDENHNKIEKYAKPIKYTHWNIQYVKAASDLIEFGQMVSNMKLAVIPNNELYANKFKEFDLAYLDNANPENETINGKNANYRIYAVRPQNTIIKIYFLKLTK